MKTAVSMSVSSEYRRYRSSLSVDFKRFTASMTSGISFGSDKVVFQCGTSNNSEPIGMKLISIDRAFDDSFFETLSKKYQCQNLAQRRINVKKILKEYPVLEGAKKYPQGIITYRFLF